VTLSRLVIVRTFARSFLIQGSWNYHTMLGTGFSWALLPGLRRLHPDDTEAFEAAAARHVELFNAHPYLAGVALGSVLSLEAEGRSPETVSRFKTAVRGPLGSLGDQLVWAGLLPLSALVGLVLYWLGLGAFRVVVAFLVLYNSGHLALRWWGLRTGLRGGTDVARTLSAAHLGERAAGLRPWLVLLTGVVAGVLLGRPSGLVEAGWAWAALGGLAFGAGLKGGHRVWRPAAVATVAAVVVISLLGVVP
jgi:PTS system mannose-specific IID component